MESLNIQFSESEEPLFLPTHQTVLDTQISPERADDMITIKQKHEDRRLIDIKEDLENAIMNLQTAIDDYQENSSNLTHYQENRSDYEEDVYTSLIEETQRELIKSRNEIDEYSNEYIK